ncbi:MAG: D-TA family PLP-dependent enzyme [Planctomycetaceae bacterium]
MDPRYHVENTSEIITPALLVFREIVADNIERMIDIAGSPGRLRPHCKTHKTAEVAQMQLDRGIAKHKCATFAEAEMLADAGVKDVFLAYNLVGANIARAVKFVQKYPHVQFSVTADAQGPIAQLGDAMQAAGTEIGVLLDVDTGQHRTGVAVGDRAKQLYRQISAARGLQPGGFHVYDGHQHQRSREERRAAVLAEFNKVLAFRDELAAEDLPVPRMVCGGTGSFPIYAGHSEPTIECSPGTCVYQDTGYGAAFPDLEFTPAALLLTRIVSRPTDDRLTLDLGYKAVASDPPAGSRMFFPELPEAEQVLQNEEHLVLQTPRAGEFQPGDELLAIPRHICPTSALHKKVYVIAGGRFVERWRVASRDRWITI